jgi:hypothetical protein
LLRKIIQLEVEGRDGFVNGMNLLYIYDRQMENGTIPSVLNAAPPRLINRLPLSGDTLKPLAISL